MQLACILQKATASSKRICFELTNGSSELCTIRDV